MKNFKFNKIMLLPLTLLGALPFVSAAVDGPSGSLSGLFKLLQNVLVFISDLFDFRWLAGHEIGFMKFLLWILIFAIFFAAGNILFARLYGNAAGPARRNAMIVSIIIATTTILLVPGSLIATIFTAYSTVIVFLLIIIPIAVIIYFLYLGPLTAAAGNGPMLHILRLLGLLLCWILLSVISSNADKLTGTTTFLAPFLLLMPDINFKNNRRMR